MKLQHGKHASLPLVAQKEISGFETGVERFLVASLTAFVSIPNPLDFIHVGGTAEKESPQELA